MNLSRGGYSNPLPIGEFIMKFNFKRNNTPSTQTLVSVQQTIINMNLDGRPQLSKDEVEKLWTPREFIPLKELSIDKEYQRMLNTMFLKKTKSFKPDLFSDLIVAIRPNGNKVIVDGQHSAALAMIFIAGNGDVEVPCKVPDSLRHPAGRSIEDCIKAEAEYFDKFNYLRNNPTALARLRAGIASKADTALWWQQQMITCNVKFEDVGAVDGETVKGLAKFKTSVSKYGVDTTSRSVSILIGNQNLWEKSTKDPNDKAWKKPMLGGLILGVTATLDFLDYSEREGLCDKTQKESFLEFLNNNLYLTSPTALTDKTSGVIMDFLILDKIIAKYDQYSTFALKQTGAVEWTKKALLEWKASEVNAKKTYKKSNTQD